MKLAHAVVRAALAAANIPASTWLPSAIAAAAAIAAAVLTARSASKAQRIEDGAALRDDQRELIKELRADNAEQRARIVDQARELREMRADNLDQARELQDAQRRIHALETALRDADIPIPPAT